MLNTKALTELLSHNRDGRLCKRWYLMTPNGTLLSYSLPNEINHLRKQAAMAAISWLEYRQQCAPGPGGDGESCGGGDIRQEIEPSPLHLLIIESETSNILMRKIQKQLLLVLEGGVPPKRTAFVKRITAESEDGTQLRPLPDDSSATTSSGSATNRGHSVAASVLKLQRQKLDTLAEAIVADFERAGFHMPEDPGSTVF